MDFPAQTPTARWAAMLLPKRYASMCKLTVAAVQHGPEGAIETPPQIDTKATPTCILELTNSLTPRTRAAGMGPPRRCRKREYVPGRPRRHPPILGSRPQRLPQNQDRLSDQRLPRGSTTSTCATRSCRSCERRILSQEPRRLPISSPNPKGTRQGFRAPASRHYRAEVRRRRNQHAQTAVPTWGRKDRGRSRLRSKTLPQPH